MSFLRRVLGGGSSGADRAVSQPAADPAADAVDDARREAELLAEEADRLSDELLARQLRYADRAWVPPAQGGSKRADDEPGGVPDSE